MLKISSRERSSQKDATVLGAVLSSLMANARRQVNNLRRCQQRAQRLHCLTGWFLLADDVDPCGEGARAKRDVENP